MAIQPDAKTAGLRFLQMLPAWGWVVRLLNRATAGDSAVIPDHYTRKVVAIPRSNGHGTIRTLVIAPKKIKQPLPLVIHYHGGGHIMGTPEASSLAPIVNFITVTDAVFVAPDYILATDAPYPSGHDDCYDALLWAAENASELGANEEQIIIGGESAGGGLTLSTALRARDEGKVNIAFQFPIYPMADDREESWNKLPRRQLSWNVGLNRLGWDMLLGKGRRGGPDVTAYEAPARASSVKGLPPTMTYVGTNDLFYTQTVDFVNRLEEAGVPLLIKEYTDVFHGQEVLAPKSAMADVILENYRSMFLELLGKYRAKQPNRRKK